MDDRVSLKRNTGRLFSDLWGQYDGKLFEESVDLVEQWAGYEYYRDLLLDGKGEEEAVTRPVQGSRDPSVRSGLCDSALSSQGSAPCKRLMQTPQREWLRNELKDWAQECVEAALVAYGGVWLDRAAVRHTWQTYCNGVGDNSFYVWQWINLELWKDCSLPNRAIGWAAKTDH